MSRHQLATGKEIIDGHVGSVGERMEQKCQIRKGIQAIFLGGLDDEKMTALDLAPAGVLAKRKFLRSMTKGLSNRKYM